MAKKNTRNIKRKELIKVKWVIEALRGEKEVRKCKKILHINIVLLILLTLSTTTTHSEYRERERERNNWGVSSSFLPIHYSLFFPYIGTHFDFIISQKHSALPRISNNCNSPSHNTTTSGRHFSFWARNFCLFPRPKKQSKTLSIILFPHPTISI